MIMENKLKLKEKDIIMTNNNTRIGTVIHIHPDEKTLDVDFLIGDGSSIEFSEFSDEIKKNGDSIVETISIYDITTVFL